MSGSLCGPSNALQSLTKHTSVDRSLQRDRLAPNRSQAGTPLSSFRSVPPHANSQVDHEFASFSGLQSRAPPAFEPLQVAPGPQSQFNAHHQPLQDGWATDFQRLEIGPSQPVLQSKGSTYFNAAPAFQTAGPAAQWRDEFSVTRAESAAGFVGPSLIPMMQPSYNPGFSTLSQLPMHQSPAMPGQQLKVQEEFQFDESAFESAFEMAARQLDEAVSTHMELGQDDHATLAQAVQESQSAQSEEQSKDQDGDELARTAGQLLDSVKGDSSQKFKNSNFLALMRKLRDHEVVIKGDAMVESGAPQAP